MSGQQPGWQGPPRRTSPALLVALGLVVVVLGLAAGAGVWWFRHPAQPVSGPATPTADPNLAPTTEPPTPEPATTEPPTRFPPGAHECTSGEIIGGIARSAAGNEVTSCPFAENVRRAYGSQPGREGTLTVTARSPVTGSSYTMSCTHDGMVTCRGGNQALVYLL